MVHTTSTAVQVVERLNTSKWRCKKRRGLSVLYSTVEKSPRQRYRCPFSVNYAGLSMCQRDGLQLESLLRTRDQMFVFLDSVTPRAGLLGIPTPRHRTVLHHVNMILPPFLRAECEATATIMTFLAECFARFSLPTFGRDFCAFRLILFSRYCTRRKV